MDALIPGILGALIGLTVMRRATRKQLRINEAVLQRDLQVLAMLPEDSEHRAEIRRRVDRTLAIDVGRPDAESARRAIRQHILYGLLTAAAAGYVVADMLRTADERSDLIIGGFVVGLTGAMAALSLTAALGLSALRRRANAGSAGE